jgi:hypothetical protein
MLLAGQLFPGFDFFSCGWSAPPHQIAKPTRALTSSSSLREAHCDCHKLENTPQPCRPFVMTRFL